MAAHHRINHVRNIKATLDYLYEELRVLKMGEPAMLVGAASEALSDILQQTPPKLHLVVGGRRKSRAC